MRSRAQLAAENLFLRKQLALYQERKVKPRLADDATRVILVWLSHFLAWRQLLLIVKPETLIRWHDKETGDAETRDIRHVFMMTGANPNTRWLDGCIALDEKGFVKTGPDLSPEELRAAKWPYPRSPFLLETNRPGIFAVGDVRGGNVKRVASAVGEGSIAVAFVHQVLQT